MIKFFRKIRYELMEKNKTGKYFKYAIGEIVLVVIGILIALQLNNLNEERKNARDLRPALQALQSEIQENIFYLNTQIKNIETDLQELEYFINILNTSEPLKIRDTLLNNVLQQIGPESYLPLRKNAYSNLFNSGLINHIKNDTLKLKINDIERGFQFYQKRLDNMKINWDQSLKPYYLENSDLLALRDTLYQKKVPNRYFQINRFAFINNRNFINTLTVRTYNQQSSKNTFKNICERLEKIQNQINVYLVSN